MKKILLSLSLLASLASQVSYTLFDNSGLFRSESSTLTADILNNTGTIEGVDYVNLKCDKLTGNGLIKGPKIEIFATECDYEGEINCSEECVLTTNTDPAKLKFHFVGKGTLVIKTIA